MGYRALSNVVLTPYLRSAAQRLADALPFDIVVTSGLRTARAQASAMETKYDLAGGGSAGRQELVDTYRDDDFANGVADFFQANDFEGAVGFIQMYFSSGKGSSHAWGAGFDVRTTGGASNQLSESQIAILIDTVSSFGWEPHREYTPPHLHITLPKKKPVAWVWLLGVAIGALLWIQKN